MSLILSFSRLGKASMPAPPTLISRISPITLRYLSTPASSAAIQRTRSSSHASSPFVSSTTSISNVLNATLQSRPFSSSSSSSYFPLGRGGSRYERFETSFPPPDDVRYGSSGGSGGGNGGRGGGWRRSPIYLALRRRLGDRGIFIWSVGLVGGGAYYLLHLERVPETGRLRFMDVSEAAETELGLQSERETLSEYRGKILPSNHPTTRRVREIARRIVEGNGLGHMKGTSDVSVGDTLLGSFGRVFSGAGGDGEAAGLFPFGHEVERKGLGKIPGTNRQDTEWEVFVIRDDTKNAFVLPGGKIFVFEGILPVCKNDDGLASVMGHEIAHQVARHSAERMSSVKVLFVLGYLLEALGLDVGITRLLLTFLLQLPNSRRSESEADYIGIRLMAKACFDPRESTRMWERMSESEKVTSQIPGFLSTHPANTKRIQQLDQWMNEALDVRAAQACGDSPRQYEAFREHLPIATRIETVWA